AGYTDSRHKDVMAKLAAVSAKLDTMSGNLSDGQANVLAAVAGIEAGRVDVDALADALAPLLPNSADFIDALAARLAGDS
ncbi:MAG: hypothetical protein ACRDQA_17670, partial [Nocardioidaceae bacterium]